MKAAAALVEAKEVAAALSLHCGACAALSGNWLEGKKKNKNFPVSPIWCCTVHTTYCFFSDKKLKRENQCCSVFKAQKFLWMGWKMAEIWINTKLKYLITTRCLVTISSTRAQVTACSNDAFHFKWGSERYWQGNVYVGYLLIHCFPLVSNYGQIIKNQEHIGYILRAVCVCQ